MTKLPVVSVIALGIVLGLDPLTSQAFGAGRPRLARRVMWQGLYTGALVSVPCLVLMATAGLALEAFGVVPELAPETRSYVLARMPSIVPFLALVAMRSYLQAAHVTRAVVMDLAAAAGFVCREMTLLRHDIYAADEFFLTGTAAEIIPVVKCDGRPIGNGKPGPVFRQLRERFLSFVKS